MMDKEIEATGITPETWAELVKRYGMTAARDFVLEERRKAEAEVDEWIRNGKLKTGAA